MSSKPVGIHSSCENGRSGEYERSGTCPPTVDLIELCCYSPPEEPPCPPRANCPGLDVLGVAPHEIAERTLVRDLTNAVDGSDLQWNEIGLAVEGGRREEGDVIFVLHHPVRCSHALFMKGADRSRGKLSSALCP